MKPFNPHNLNPANSETLSKALELLTSNSVFSNSLECPVSRAFANNEFGLHLAILCLSDLRLDLDLENAYEVYEFTKGIIEEAKALVADLYRFARSYPNAIQYIYEGAEVIVENRINEDDDRLKALGFTLENIVNYHFNAKG